MRKTLCALTALILTILVLPLSGCVPHIELDRLGIAEAVGVDHDGSGFTVTVQFFNTDASGGVTAIDSSAPNVTVVSGTGDTIESALRQVSLSSGNNILFGSAAVIVFGKNALFSLRDALDLAASHYSGNLRAYICAARGNASDVMNVRFSEGIASVEKLKELLHNAQTLGLERPVRMLEVLERLYSPTGSVVLPLLSVTPTDSDVVEDGSTVTVAGGALCTDGRFAGELTLTQMSGLTLLDPCDGNGCELTVMPRGHETRAALYGVRALVTPGLSDGKLTLDVRISADCKIVSTTLPDPYSAKQDLEALCGGELVRRVEALLEATLHGHGADVSGLAYRLRAVSPALWRTVEPQYRELLQGSVISVSAQVRAERFSVIG